MSDDREFADLEFRIDCAEIRLIKTGEVTFEVSGPGEIWQDQDGILQFKIFVNHGREDFLQELARVRPVGQLLTPSDMYTLVAAEISGPVWRAENVWPALSGNPVGSILAIGQITEFTQVAPLPEAATSTLVTMRFLGRLKFPCNQGSEVVTSVGGRITQRMQTLNAATAEIGTHQISVVHESRHTRVNLQLPTEELREWSWLRVQEALQFILACELVPLTVLTSSGQTVTIQLRSPRGTRRTGQINEPLHFRTLDEDGHVWRIFGAYYTHILNFQEFHWHPMSCQFGSIVQASAASIDAEISALAISTEGLAGQYFRELARPSEEFLADINLVLSLLSSATVSTNGRRRIQGTMESQRNARNSDAIRAFIQRYGLDIGLVRSWSRLRNSAAHGSGTGGRAISELLRMRDEVQFLMYSIIFAAIEYSGPRTDYSAPGFPTTQWPPSSEVSDRG